MAQNSRLKQLKSQQKVNRIPERYLAGMVSVFPGNPDENGNVIFLCPADAYTCVSDHVNALSPTGSINVWVGVR